MAKTKRTIELNLTTPDEKKPSESVSAAPLFAGGSTGDETDVLDHIVLTRTKPLREPLGKVAADASEEDIVETYGGGTFRCIGRTDRNKPISGAFATIELPGDPIWQDEVTRKRWEKIRRQQLGPDEKTPNSDPVALEEARHRREIDRIKAEADAKVAAARAEAEVREAAEERRRAREREDRHAEAEEREAREDARRTRERDERAEERRQDREAREREQAAQRDHERQLEAARTAERAAERETRSDPLAQFAAFAQILEAVKGPGGSGFEDPETAAMARLPETIREIRETVIAEKMGGKGGDDEGDPLTFSGELGERGKRLVRRLVAQGKSEQEIAQILGRAFDVVGKMQALPARREPGRSLIDEARRPAAPEPRGNANAKAGNQAAGTVRTKAKIKSTGKPGKPNGRAQA